MVANSIHVHSVNMFVIKVPFFMGWSEKIQYFIDRRTGVQQASLLTTAGEMTSLASFLQDAESYTDSRNHGTSH